MVSIGFDPIFNWVNSLIQGFVNFLLDMLRAALSMLEKLIIKTPYPSQRGSTAPRLRPPETGIWSDLYALYANVVEPFSALLLAVVIIVIYYMDLFDDVLPLKKPAKGKKRVFVALFIVLFWWEINVLLLAVVDGVAQGIASFTYGSSTAGGLVGLVDGIQNQLSGSLGAQAASTAGIFLFFGITLFLQFSIIGLLLLVWFVRYIVILALSPTIPLFYVLSTLKIPGFEGIADGCQKVLTKYIEVLSMSIPGAIIIGLGTYLSTLILGSESDGLASDVVPDSGAASGDLASASSSISGSSEGTVGALSQYSGEAAATSANISVAQSGSILLAMMMTAIVPLVAAGGPLYLYRQDLAKDVFKSATGAQLKAAGAAAGLAPTDKIKSATDKLKSNRVTKRTASVASGASERFSELRETTSDLAASAVDMEYDGPGSARVRPIEKYLKASEAASSVAGKAYSGAKSVSNASQNSISQVGEKIKTRAMNKLLYGNSSGQSVDEWFDSEYSDNIDIRPDERLGDDEDGVIFEYEDELTGSTDLFSYDGVSVAELFKRYGSVPNNVRNEIDEQLSGDTDVDEFIENNSMSEISDKLDTGDKSLYEFFLSSENVSRQELIDDVVAKMDIQQSDEDDIRSHLPDDVFETSHREVPFSDSLSTFGTVLRGGAASYLDGKQRGQKAASALSNRRDTDLDNINTNVQQLAGHINQVEDSLSDINESADEFTDAVEDIKKINEDGRTTAGELNRDVEVTGEVTMDDINVSRRAEAAAAASMAGETASTVASNLSEGAKRTGRDVKESAADTFSDVTQAAKEEHEAVETAHESLKEFGKAAEEAKETVHTVTESKIDTLESEIEDRQKRGRFKKELARENSPKNLSETVSMLSDEFTREDAIEMEGDEPYDRDLLADEAIPSSFGFSDSSGEIGRNGKARLITLRKLFESVETGKFNENLDGMSFNEITYTARQQQEHINKKARDRLRKAKQRGNTEKAEQINKAKTVLTSGTAETREDMISALETIGLDEDLFVPGYAVDGESHPDFADDSSPLTPTQGKIYADKETMRKRYRNSDVYNEDSDSSGEVSEIAMKSMQQAQRRNLVNQSTDEVTVYENKFE